VTSFSVIVMVGIVCGAWLACVYDRPHDTSGTYNPSPQTVYLGANDAAQESGSYAGAIYRNLWVGSRPRPESLGSALQAP
jgi:hypothetical protein